MGLSSSQSRFLTLTARLCDLELKAQNIQHQKIRLAEQSTEASKVYMDALDAQTMKFNSVDNGQVDATISNITLLSDNTYRIIDSKGYFYTVDANNVWHKVNKNDSNDILDVDEEFEPKLNDPKYLLEQLDAAHLFIQKVDQEDPNYWNDYSYISSSVFVTENDTTELAKAEAEYEHTMAEIQEKDKRFDLDLDNINTEHSAVDTEMDSVKNVVDKNIDKTFQIFS